MPGKKLSEHLTVRVFLLTFLILLFSGAVTFALIAWAAPSTYTSVVSESLQRQVDSLIEQLRDSDVSDSGPLLDSFIQSSHARVLILADDGTPVDTGSLLALNENDPETRLLLSAAQTPEAKNFSAAGEFQISVTSDRQSAARQQYAILRDFSFAGEREIYRLCVAPVLQEENWRPGPGPHDSLASSGPADFLPFMRIFLLPLYYTSHSSHQFHWGQMAQLDFSRQCAERRRDEIGAWVRASISCLKSFHLPVPSWKPPMKPSGRK